MNFNASLYLKDITGVDITKIFGISEISALEILSEVGIDMSKWPNEKHFTSWLNLAPNTRVSGGKYLKSKKQKKKIELHRHSKWLPMPYKEAITG